MVTQTIWGATDLVTAAATMRLPADTSSSSGPGYLSVAELGTFFTGSSIAATGTVADGKILIGSTSTGGLALANLTAGANITITNSAGNITIASTGGGSSAFNSLTSGTNTTAAMVVGSGATLAATGSGTITATAMAASGLTGLVGLAHGGTNSDLSATGGTSQVLKQTSSGGAVTVGPLAFSDISGTAAAAQLPLATTGAFGAVKPDGTTITISGGVISAATGGTGTVTSVSIVSANGFSGTVATPTTTPAITLTTSITGVLKGNGTAISAAAAGTDYQAPITLTTTGTSGAATLIANTLNIPQYTAGGSGTVNSGTSGQITYYSATGTAVSGNANATISAGALTLGVAGSAQGSLILSGSTSGTTTLAAPVSGGGTMTLQAGTDTIVGRATTDTLTNKTLTAPVMTAAVLGTPASGTLTNCTGLPVAGGGTGVATLTGIVKGNGTSAFTAATAGTDYVAPGTATSFTAQQNFGAAALTSGASIAWNLNTQQSAKLTLATNATLSNPTNMVDGGTYILRITQDATGSRTLAYGAAYKWPGGTAPTLSTAANAIDVLTFTSDGTNMYGVSQLAFS